jgi:DNA replication protein DnaC
MIKLKSDILEEYRKKRSLADERIRQKKMAIYEAIPQLEEIDDKIAEISLQSSRALLGLHDGGGIKDMESGLEELRRNIDSLKMQKAFILTESHLGLNYLDPEYECPLCKDTGYLDNRVMCNCFKQKISEKLYDMSNISRVMAIENFDTFDMSRFSNENDTAEGMSPRQNMETILRKSQDFVSSFHSNVVSKSGKNLLFYGSTGLGKTFLCNAIAKNIIDEGHTVVYQTSYRLIEMLGKLKFSSSNYSQSSNESIQYELLKDCDLLIIDDLGTELINTFTNSEFFNIINSRILSGKSVVISTNLSPQDLMDSYSTRISSRIFGCFDMIKFFGNDLRWERR